MVHITNDEFMQQIFENFVPATYYLRRSEKRRKLWIVQYGQVLRLSGILPSKTCPLWSTNQYQPEECASSASGYRVSLNDLFPGYFCCLGFYLRFANTTLRTMSAFVPQAHIICRSDCCNWIPLELWGGISSSTCASIALESRCYRNPRQLKAASGTYRQICGCSLLRGRLTWSRKKRV